MRNGAVGIAPNGIWPYGVAPNEGENGVTTARPAPPALNPALYPNVNANGGANVNPNMNQANQNGAWLWRQSPQAGSHGFGARNYNLQSFSQFNNYGGRTFARGNPRYFGIRRYYANGSYFSSFRAGQGR
jgi:hypothetical protein